MNTESGSVPQSVAEATPKEIIEGKKLPKNTSEAAKFVANIKDLVSDPTAGKDKTITIINNFKKELGKKTDRGAEIARLAVGVELGLSVVGSVKKIAAKQADMELAVREEDELNNIDLNIFIAKALGITGDLTDLGEYFDDVSGALGIETKFNLKEELSNRSKSRRNFLRTSAVAAAAVGLVAVGVSSNPFEKKPTTPPKTPASLPTPEAAPIASPVPTTKELTPPPPVVTPVPQEHERLIPNPIRMLQNETLNRLWREGEIELRKVVVNGREVMVIDVAKAKTAGNSKLKFAQLLKNNPVDDRIFNYTTGRDTEVAILQIMSTCATHSFVNAALHLGGFKDEKGLPVVINPIILAEATDLTFARYQEIQNEIKRDDVYKKQYADIDQAAQNAALNLGLQQMKFDRPDQSRLEKVIKSVFGLKLDRSIGGTIEYPDDKANPGKLTFKANIFAPEQWAQLKQKYSLEIKGDQILASAEDGRQIHGIWMENWYKSKVSQAEGQNQKTAPLFSMRWDETGMNHLFLVLGTEVINGKTYFHMVEPHAGEVSPYLHNNGFIKSSKDGSCYIPTDKLWQIGLAEVYTMTNEQTSQIKAANYPEERTPPLVQEREVLRTEQLGFRVNSVEAINKLPDGIGIIRIAGNNTTLTPGGEFADPNLKDMLEVAHQKGLKVVFTYNPNWFPGMEGKPATIDEVNKNEDMIKSRMQAQISKILQYDNVILEVGNEPDETTHFWSGNIESFGKFFQMAANIAYSIKPDAKIILAAFSSPQDNLGQLNRLVNYLKNSSTSLPNFVAAIHAYDSVSLKWALDNLPGIFGKKDLQLMVTEMNSNRRNSQSFVPELQKMLDLVRQRGVSALIHEFKPEAYTLDYTGADYNVNLSDPRFSVISQQTNMLVALSSVKQREVIALAPQATKAL